MLYQELELVHFIWMEGARKREIMGELGIRAYNLDYNSTRYLRPTDLWPRIRRLTRGWSNSSS